MTCKKFDVVVSGGGIIGTASALSLAKVYENVLLIERGDILSKEVSPKNEQVFMLSESSINFLNDLISNKIYSSGELYPVKTMNLFDDKHNRLILDSDVVEKKCLGYTVKKSFILGSLHDALAKSNVTLRGCDEVVKIDLFESESVLSLEKSSKITTGLLVVADGSRSKLRDLTGIRCDLKDFDQTAIVCQLDVDQTKFCAYQWFQSGGGVMALLPTTESSFTLVWSISSEMSRKIISGGTCVLRDELMKVIGRTFKNINIVSDIEFFPITSIITKDVINSSLVLVGEAANSIHPMAGQGLNLGLRDVKILSDILGKEQGKSMQASLRAYKRQRAEKVAIMSSLTNFMHYVFSENSFICSKARELGFISFSKNNLLKRLAIKIATN